MKTSQFLKPVLIIGCLLAASLASATTKIAILGFELNDLTYLPNTQAEQRRTGSMKALLEQDLKAAGYELVQVPAEAYAKANASLGYVFKFDQLAAQLGKQAGADWVIVGQHAKPSFLFSYLLAHLIQVQTAGKVASYAIELKGNHEKVTQHGIMGLSEKIAGVLGQR